MQITRSSIETRKGSAAWFTGDVYVDAVAAPTETSTFAAALVHFTPGARTAWHTHPKGRRSSSPRAQGSANAKADPSKRSVPATESF